MSQYRVQKDSRGQYFFKDVSQDTMAANPHDILAEINRGNFKLRPTITVDKSSPFIRANGENIARKIVTPGVGDTPLAPVAPPPPPQINGKEDKIPRSKQINPDARDQLLSEIQQGKRLRPTVTIDKSAPMISGTVRGDGASNDIPIAPVAITNLPEDMPPSATRTVNEEVKNSKRFQQIRRELDEQSSVENNPVPYSDPIKELMKGAIVSYEHKTPERPQIEYDRSQQIVFNAPEVFEKVSAQPVYQSNSKHNGNLESSYRLEQPKRVVYQPKDWSRSNSDDQQISNGWNRPLKEQPIPNQRYDAKIVQGTGVNKLDDQSRSKSDNQPISNGWNRPLKEQPIQDQHDTQIVRATGVNKLDDRSRSNSDDQPISNGWNRPLKEQPVLDQRYDTQIGRATGVNLLDDRSRSNSDDQPILNGWNRSQQPQISDQQYEIVRPSNKSNEWNRSNDFENSVPNGWDRAQTQKPIVERFEAQISRAANEAIIHQPYDRNLSNGKLVTNGQNILQPLGNQRYEPNINTPVNINNREPLSWKQWVVPVNNDAIFSSETTVDLESPKLVKEVKFPDVLPIASPEIIARSQRPDILSSRLVATVPRSPTTLAPRDPNSTESWKRKFAGSSPPNGSEKSFNFGSKRSPEVSMDFETNSSSTASEDMEILSQTLPSVQSLKGNFENNGVTETDSRNYRQTVRAKVINITSENPTINGKNGGPAITYGISEVNRRDPSPPGEPQQAIYHAAKARILPDVSAIAGEFERKGSAPDLRKGTSPFTNGATITSTPAPYGERFRRNSATGPVTIGVAPPSVAPSTTEPRPPRVVSTTTAFISNPAQVRRGTEPATHQPLVNGAPGFSARRATYATVDGVPVRVDTPWVVKKGSVPQVAGTPEMKAKLESIHFTRLVEHKQTVGMTNGNKSNGNGRIVDLEELQTMDAGELRMNYEFNIDVNNPDQLIQIQQR